MRPHLRPGLLAALLLAPLAARAAPAARLTVAGVSGEAPQHTVSRQLLAALCGTYQCVPRPKVYTGNQPDFAKVRKERVAGIVFGSVTAKAGKRHAWLALLTTSTKPARTWTFALGSGGALSQASLDRLDAEIDAILRASASRAPPPAAAAGAAAAGAAAAATPPARAPAPVPAPVPVAPPAAPPPAGAAAAGAGAAAAAAPPPAIPPQKPLPPEKAPGAPGPNTRAEPAQAAAPAAPRPLLAAAELGVLVTSRKLTYSGASPPGTIPLAEYSIDAIVAPAVRVELYPLSLSTRGAAAGLGAFAEYEQSVGLTTESASAPGTKHDSTFSRLLVGAAWRLRPARSSAFTLVPSVGWEWQSFRVEPVGGAGIAGLPDSSLSGVRLGLDAEIPLGDRFGLLLGAAYVYWTTAEDLVGGFFPGGSAYALEADAGLWVRLFGPVSLRVTGAWSSTSYTLDPDPSGRYVATGAKDAYLGGRATIRGTF